MTSNPDDPNRPFEYPSLEQSPPRYDPYAPVDYPTYPPPAYPPPPGYTPGYPPGYPPSGFPPPYQPYAYDPYDPYRATPVRGTNGWALAALLTAIVGLIVTCGFVSPLGIVFGIMGMRETKRTGQEGYGLALAGLIIGAVVLAFWVIIMIAAIVSPSDTSSSYSY